MNGQESDAQKGGCRILAIVPSAFCFGLQNVTLATFELLSKKHACHFLVTRWNDGEFPKRLQNLQIPFTSTWLGMFSRKLDWANLKMTLECLFKLPSAYLAFLRIYRRFRPTCILMANHHETILLWPMLIFLKRKVVCHMHDPPPPIGFQRASFHWWRRAIGRFLFISHNAKARLSDLGPLGPNDVVIWNGVALNELTLPRRRNDRFTKKFNWPGDSVIVGLTGQMTPTKGHEDFIRAAVRVLASNPRARFVIGGKRSESYFTQLEALIAKEGLVGSVEFCGWLETSAEFFEAIDLFVLASRHDEGFGLVLAEAGERGLASVATRSGGATEIVVDNETGILVNKSNPAEMATAIEKLVSNEQLREHMGARARGRISEFFNLARQSEKIEEILGVI